MFLTALGFKAVLALALISLTLNAVLFGVVGVLWRENLDLKAGVSASNVELKKRVEDLAKANQELNRRLHALSYELNLTKRQLEYYRAQAEYYSSLMAEQGGMGKSITGEALVNVVAVKMVPVDFFEARYEGVTMLCKVQLVSGEGRVLVNTVPRIGIDLQTSARTAVMVAQRLTGVSLNSTDVVVTIMAESEVDIVDGPSAGAAITLAVMAAIQGVKLNSTVFITGTVNPDGSIGEVGGVVEKAVAAAERGGKLFLVPRGQSKVPVWVRVRRQVAPGVVVEWLETRIINLEGYLRDKGYSIRVVEVGNVLQAYKLFATQVAVKTA